MSRDTSKRQAAVRYKCRNSYCPNHYDGIIGQTGWTQKAGLKGAECIPCLYAGQMVDQGQTIAQVEAHPHLMGMFVNLLGNTGWTWQHVKDSYERMAALTDEQRRVM